LALLGKITGVLLLILLPLAWGLLVDRLFCGRHGGKCGGESCEGNER